MHAKLEEAAPGTLLRDNIIMQLMRKRLQGSAEKLAALSKRDSADGSHSASRPEITGSDRDKKAAEVTKYQEKMMRIRKSRQNKKLQDKLRKLAKLAGKKGKNKSPRTGGSISPRGKNTEGSQATLTQDDQEEEVDEAEERKAKLARLSEIGNATKVGAKPGERPAVQTVIDNDFNEDHHQVSIFRRDVHHRQDVHMAIISKHRAELVREALGSHLRERLAATFTKKRSRCCLAVEKFLTCHWEYFVPEEIPYLNKHSIEEYIDSYFLLHVPETLSLSENHEQVYNLIHDLFIQENELARHEAQADCRAQAETSEDRRERDLAEMTRQEDRDLAKLLRPRHHKKNDRSSVTNENFMSYESGQENNLVKVHESAELLKDIEKGQQVIK